MDYICHILYFRMKILDKIFKQNQKTNNKVENTYSHMIKG